MFFLIFPIIIFFSFWLILSLNIYVTEKRMNKIDELELELSSEFEIKSLRGNDSLFFYIVILILFIFALFTYPNTLLKELTYKSAFGIILLIGLIIFYVDNFFEELKNRKYSLSISGETVKIFYENKEINAIKTDDIHYIEFYEIHHRREMVEPNPILRIFDNEKKCLWKWR